MESLQSYQLKFGVLLFVQGEKRSRLGIVIVSTPSIVPKQKISSFHSMPIRFLLRGSF